MNLNENMKSEYSESEPAAESAVPIWRRISRAQHCRRFIWLIVGWALLAPLAHKATPHNATSTGMTTSVGRRA
jgi:hypothetical protein